MSIQDDGVYLIDGTRTAIGAYGGSSAHTRPDDMAATIIRSLLQRHPAAEASRRSGSGLRQPGRRGQPQCRPHGGAACRTGSVGAGHHPQPPLRLRVGCRDLRRGKIRSGLSELILAGGVESMSRAPYVLSKSETPFDKG